MASNPRVTDGYAVLTVDPEVEAAVTGAAAGRRCFCARDVEELISLVAAANPSVVVIDGRAAAAGPVLHRLQELAGREQSLVVLVGADPLLEPPPGADVVALLPVLHEALSLADRAFRGDERAAIALDRLLSVSLLSGTLDQVLEDAADALAAGLGADRCLISVRGDSTGCAATGTGTWSSLSWSQTAERCRAAAASGATLMAPAADDGVADHAAVDDEALGACESYLAVPLDSALGTGGFLGLVVGRPHIFSDEDRDAVRAVAARLVAELGWRGLHERTAEELDRIANGPGLDPLLGTWNRPALDRLAAMQVSASRRSAFALSALVLDVLDLQGINNRFGLEVGDRLLQRLADAVRATVREDDLVGRWSGDEIAVVLHGAGIQEARRVADRLQASLAQRPLELPAGGSLAISTTIGLAALQAEEEPAQLLQRAARAAERARSTGERIAAADTQSGKRQRFSRQMEAAGEEVAATLGGAFRLLHEISRGGMGVVYRAEDLALERQVAIKMLRPDLAEDAELVERFRIEASMLAHLQHPNLVQVYSFGHSAGDSYFVMELVEGESLEQAFERHRLEGTALPLRGLASVIEQVASALDALHDRGIVHRDVKPANVILDPFRDRSVLVDVGIARRYGQYTTSAGTPGYVAPEVIAGEEASPRSDVYGLAATAYTMLTLETPWGKGDLRSVLARQRGGELEPPSALRPELAAVDDLILGALGVSPCERPASAGEFARELAAALVAASPAVEQEAPRTPTGKHAARAPERAVPDSAARTRGIVFRSVARALGVREAERLRDAIGGEHPDLARALTHDTAPLSWLPTQLLVGLLAVAPVHVGREPLRLARDIARATVRASFRRFFPASTATLVPERTLSAIRNVWGRYQSWGAVSSMPIHGTEVVVRITDTPRQAALCAWTSGMLEQLVVLSGGRRPSVAHETCEATGGEACLFRVTWDREA